MEKSNEQQNVNGQVDTDSQNTSNEEKQDQLRGRGIQANIPEDEQLPKEMDEKLKINEDPVIHDESEDKKEKNEWFDYSKNIGGVSSGQPSDAGLNFETKIGEEEAEEQKDGEKKETIYDLYKSDTPSGTPEEEKPRPKSKSKYFDNVDPNEMTRITTEYQQENPEEFKSLMLLGNELIKCCVENDVAGFHSRIIGAANTNVLFWHTSKGFKKALDNFHKEIIDYMLNTLQVDLSHEVFRYILHYLITRSIKLVDDIAQQKYATEILELIVNARKGVVNIDEIDPTHGHITGFQMACFYGLHQMADVLLDAGADVNAVDNCNKTPLGLLQLRTMKAQLDQRPELKQKLEELTAKMEAKGAVLDWKKAEK